MTWLAICICLFAMLVGIQIAHIPHLPRCPFCGKTREHARDCPSRR